MTRYREFTAPAEFVGLVDCLWREDVDAAEAKRIVPDGCVDVIWNGRSASIAGPDTEPWTASLAARTTLTGIRFAPGVAPAVLGVPASDLRNCRVCLDDVWSRPDTERLVERLSDSGSAAELAAGFTSALRNAAVDPVARALTTRLRIPTADPGGAEPWTVRDLAADLGLSERHLQRRCVAAFGYGPKTLHRVLRFHAAVALARQGRPFAYLAAVTGYADQAHLSREVRTLAGTSLTRLLRH